MFKENLEEIVVPSFEDLSLEEMQTLQGDEEVQAEISPTTTSSMPCATGFGGGFTVVASIKNCF